MRTWVAVAGAAGVACIIMAILVLARSPERSWTSPEGPQGQKAPGVLQESGGSSPEDPRVDITPGLLRKAYGTTITHPRAQIALLEELMAFLMERYPDDWEGRLASLVRQAFPDRADEILRRLSGLQRYNEWLARENPGLMGMARKERERVLWEKRREVFGTEAELIWASELKGSTLSDVLDEIASDSRSTLYEKLDTYAGAIDRIYGDKDAASPGKRSFELIGEFLGVASVQRDLAAMSPEERKQGLRHVRAVMGLDDAALSRLEALDEQRDLRWKTGEQYMRERAELVRACSGPDQEEEIQALRQRCFGAQAGSIAKEEAAGFFRFSRQRVYGMN